MEWSPHSYALFQSAISLGAIPDAGEAEETGSVSALAGSTVGLVDIQPEILELSNRIIARMIAQTGADLRVQSSTDRREVLPGSDYVLNSISVGEPWARERDVEIGERYGIYQPTSQTVGPAGFVRGLRVIPHAVAIARDVAAICPNALLIDLANPMAAVTEMAQRNMELWADMQKNFFASMGLDLQAENKKPR